MRGSYGNILQNTYNSRTNTFGSNRAISLDHYSNHRRMSDGIQTVTSDSTVYYHQRLHDQDSYSLLRVAGVAVGKKKSSSCQGSTDVKLLVNEEAMSPNNASQPTTLLAAAKFHTPINVMMAAAAAADHSDTNRVQSSAINHNNNNNNNNSSNSSLTGKSVKSKMSSSVTCSSNSPKSIITRLRQLTGRLSFSFDKDARRMSTGGSATSAAQGAQTIIKTSPVTAKNNNMMVMPNMCVCSNTKSAAPGDATSRNRAYSLDVPPTRYNNSSAGSSNNGSHRSLSSNRGNDEADDSTTDTNSVFMSKKMSAEVESMDI
jgi:hypothetical protein